MPWLREGDAACLVACERRPTNSFSVVSQPRPLCRQGENPILEASFPYLTIENQERYFYLVLQVDLETSLSGCFIVCIEIKPSHVPHKALHSSKPEALPCALFLLHVPGQLSWAHLEQADTSSDPCPAKFDAADASRLFVVGPRCLFGHLKCVSLC